MGKTIVRTNIIICKSNTNFFLYQIKAIEELEGILKFENSIKQWFYYVVAEQFAGYNLSPLRIADLKLKFHRDGVEVFSSLIDNAPPISEIFYLVVWLQKSSTISY